MTFIIVLIVVLIERFFELIDKVRPWGWLPKYSAALDKKFGKHKAWRGYLRLASIVLPFVIIVAIIQGVIVGKHLTWLEFLYSLIILLYCVGPKSFYALFARVLKKAKTDGDSEKAESTSEPEDDQPDNLASDAEEAETVVKDVVDVPEDFDPKEALVSVNRVVFAALFWFVILGPLGCVLYRLCERNCEGDGSAKMVTRVLDWIPVRLFAFTYALIGNFVAVIPTWLKKVFSSVGENENILRECGEKALGEERELLAYQVQSLIDRAFIVWLVVLALIMLF